ncbi:Gmad2 immunoglobulin-like domain-containing protein [Micromonospora sp. M12]
MAPVDRPAPTRTPTAEPTPPPTDEPRRPSASADTGTRRPDPVSIELWYVRAGLLVPTRRTRPATVATSRLALAELAAGPTAAEAATGMTTLLPAGVEVTRIADGVAALLLLRRRPGTATAARGPGGLDAHPVPHSASGPRRRGGPGRTGGLRDLLPPIVVTSPVPGERVVTPLVVTGTATVFEATVSVRVLDATGREVATGFGTASCGTGCRGGYRVVVGWRTAREQQGTIEVYEVSARDGSRINTMAVPVLLGPGG